MSFIFDCVDCNCLLKKQSTTGDLVKNFLVNTKKSAGKADITKGYIQGRLVLLDKYWYQFREQHDAIIDFADESNGNLSKFYFDEGTYELIESSYSDALGYLYES